MAAMTMVAGAMPSDMIAIVLRYCCVHECASFSEQLISSFLYPQLTWYTAVTAGIGDRVAIRATQRLVEHGVPPPNHHCGCHDCMQLRKPPPHAFVDVAAANGYVETVRFLASHDPPKVTIRTLSAAARNGHIAVINLLLDLHPEWLGSIAAMRSAAEGGHSAVLERLYDPDTHVFDIELWNNAVRHGEMNVIRAYWQVYKTLTRAKREEYRPALRNSMRVAAHFGYADLLEFLINREDQAFDAQWISLLACVAADAGHQEVLQYLEWRFGMDIINERVMAGAAGRGDLATVQQLHARGVRATTTFVMDNAVVNGHVAVVEFLHGIQSVGCSANALSRTAANGHLEMVRYLHYHGSIGFHVSDEAIVAAVAHGHLALVQFLLSLRLTTLPADAGVSCIKGGHLEVLDFIINMGLFTPTLSHLRCHSAKNEDAIRFLLFQHAVFLAGEGDRASAITLWLNDAGKRGKLQQIQYIDDRRRANELFTSDAMTEAAENGHLEVVQYLHRHDHHIGWSTRTIDRAAAMGHLSIVQFLLQYRTEGYTLAAMDEAAARGELRMVQYLTTECHAPATTAAMDGAAANGRLAVVQFLHEHRSEGCTSEAMDQAAGRGHLEVVQYLHEHVDAPCTTHAMDKAAEYGSLEVVQYLHEKRTEGCTTAAMDNAVDRGHLQVLRYLHENRSEGCTQHAMDMAAYCSRLEVVRFLHENRTEVCVVIATNAWRMRFARSQTKMYLWSLRDSCACSQCALDREAREWHEART